VNKKLKKVLKVAKKAGEAAVDAVMEADSVTVTTHDELKKAIKAKTNRIVITGKLAKKVKQAERIKKLSPAVLAAIGGLSALATAALAAAAVPGVGATAALAFAAAAAPVAVSSGLSVPVLLIISGVGLAAMSLLFDEYTHFEMQDGKLVFERKRKQG